MGILEKISEIEKEIARTQKNKGVLHFNIEIETSWMSTSLSNQIPTEFKNFNDSFL